MILSSLRLLDSMLNIEISVNPNYSRDKTDENEFHSVNCSMHFLSLNLSSLSSAKLRFFLFLLSNLFIIFSHFDLPDERTSPRSPERHDFISIARLNENKAYEHEV